MFDLPTSRPLSPCTAESPGPSALASRRASQAPLLRLLGDAGGGSADGSASDEALYSEPSLFFAPPYTSPLDEAVAWHLVKYLDPACGLLDAVAGPTVGPFSTQVDLVVERPPAPSGSGRGSAQRLALRSQRVGIVYTPAATDLAERLHDALLVGSGTVDVLYRLRRADVAYHLHDVLWLLARWSPSLFSDRGCTNLATLASPAARACTPSPADVEVTLPYAEAPADEARPRAVIDTDLPAPASLTLRRRLRAQPATWRAAYDDAHARFGPPPQLAESA